MNVPNPVEVNLEFTPNPNTLKYTLNRRILILGTENFLSLQEAETYSPLAKKLLELKGIESVMLGPSFISITLDSQDHILELNEAAIKTIKTHLESGETIVVAREEAVIPDNEDENSALIRKIINTEIRPAVAMDGGDIHFSSYQNGIVYLHMEGACSGCPSSEMTLKMGIESRLRKEIPGLKKIIPV